MSTALKWKLIAGMVALFFAGVATGLFAGAWHAHHAFIKMHHGRLGDRMRQHLKSELQLTPEQAEKIAPLVDQMANKLDAIRIDTTRRVSETMKESHREIEPLLSPAQRERMEQMDKKHRHALHSAGLPPPP